MLFLLGGTTTTTTIGSTTTRLNRHMQEKTFGNQGTSPGICHIGSSIFSFNIFFRDLQLESLILVLHTQCSGHRVLCTGDRELSTTV